MNELKFPILVTLASYNETVWLINSIGMYLKFIATIETYPIKHVLTGFSSTQYLCTLLIECPKLFMPHKLRN